VALYPHGKLSVAVAGVDKRLCVRVVLVSAAELATRRYRPLDVAVVEEVLVWQMVLADGARLAVLSNMPQAGGVERRRMGGDSRWPPFLKS
jgi:hypothetical protein